MNSLVGNNFVRDIAAKAFQRRNFISDLGLIGGKMGLCINLYEIARFTNDDTMEKMADCLMDEIYSAINNATTSWYFKDGLAGIGWGIEHLVQNNFVEGNTNDILSDIDNKIILQKVYGNNRRLDLLRGFLGFGYYFTKRLQNPNSNDECFSILLIKQHLVNIIDQLDWFGSHTHLLPGEPKNITGAWVLPIILHFVYDVNDSGIYPSRVNKTIEWLLYHIEKNIPQKHYFRLLLANDIEVFYAQHINECPNIIFTIAKNISRDAIVSEIQYSNECLLFNTLGVLKGYYNLMGLNDDPALGEEIIFWNNLVEQQLDSCKIEEDKEGKILTKAENLGLLDGFKGFYTIIPALSTQPALALEQQ